MRWVSIIDPENRILKGRGDAGGQYRGGVSIIDPENRILKALVAVEFRVVNRRVSIIDPENRILKAIAAQCMQHVDQESQSSIRRIGY